MPYDIADRLNAQQKEYLDLAQSHWSKDLQESDRQALTKAGGKVSTHVTLGGFLGASLGLWAAFASRQRLHRAFALLRSAPKPREVIMDSGEHVKVPKEVLEYEMKEPGGVVTGLTGFFLASFGFLVGANLGLLTGSSSARKVVKQEANVDRLKQAYTAFRVDLLKKQIQELESGTDVWGKGGRGLW